MESIHWPISLHALTLFTSLSHSYDVLITLFWIDCTHIVFAILCIVFAILCYFVCYFVLCIVSRLCMCYFVFFVYFSTSATG
jgi:hypothetical protein